VALKKAEYGSGPLFKAAGAVYGVMVGDALLVLSNILLALAPVLVTSVNAASDAAGGDSFAGGVVVLVSFALLGPSLVAAAYAFNRLLSGEETGVFRDFFRGYRSNFRQALLVWLPYLAVLAAIALNLAYLPGSLDGNPAQAAARTGLLGLGLMVCTAAVNALLLLSRFTFRIRDIYRLSLYGLGAQKRVSLGNAGILFVTAFLLTATSVALVLFVGGAVAYLICLNSRPLLTFVEQRFTVPAG
jgi:uncharacterized membrane protein YesL